MVFPEGTVPNRAKPMFVRARRHDCPLSYDLRRDGQPNQRSSRTTDSPGRSTPTWAGQIRETYLDSTALIR
jgi:hypothetical protein